jgi:hypothetical protein
MKILLLSTDALSAQFDRRIVDLAACIVENGDEVIIQTLGEHSSLGNVQGQWVVQFPRRFKKTSGDEARGAFYNQTTLRRETGDNSQTRPVNFVRVIWSKLPNKSKPFVHKIYRRIKYFSSIRSIYASPETIADRYFSDAYNFWEVNHDGEYDLVIGTDIPSGIAAALLTAGSNKIWWYEAHEYASEQQWLKENYGYTSELSIIESYLVTRAKLFSSVSKKLVTRMETEFNRNTKSIVLHNSTRSRQTALNSKNSMPKSVLDIFEVPERIIIFHGVLSDLRGLSKFVEIFELASIPNWKFVLIGYNPGVELLRALRNAKNTSLLNAVNSQQVSEIVRRSDVVLMPYPVLDINTKYGFANKLGDCIAERVPFLYNEDLESINEVAVLTGTGLPFSWSNLSKPGELQRILEDFEKLTPDWGKAERLFGWTHFKTTISDLLTNIKKGI